MTDPWWLGFGTGYLMSAPFSRGREEGLDYNFKGSHVSGPLPPVRSQLPRVPPLSRTVPTAGDHVSKHVNSNPT